MVRPLIMKSQKIRFIVALLLAVFVGYYIGITKINLDWKNYKPHIEVVNKEPPPSLMHADFAPFWVVLDKLEKNYYDRTAIDPDKMINGAISGMVASLDDPYTMYLPPVKNTEFKQVMAGKFEGIGAELGMNGKQIIVVAPLDGSPAEKAGVKAGDAILKVDGKDIFGMTLAQTVEKIRGEKGTSVKITLVHKFATKAVDVNIVRDTIQVKSLVSWTKKLKDISQIDSKSSTFSAHLDDKIVYVRLSQFGDSTNNEWTNMALKLSEEIKADKSIKGIVFDLRNNPGGYLTDAVYIASEFIKSGAAVLQEDKNGERVSAEVTGKGFLTDVPVMVLINGGSASASEIVSGALRDHKRAMLVGDKSFGKGTIQEAEDLGGGAGIHITIAKWLTPNGTWVHKNGLEPDFPVQVDQKDPSHDTQLEKAIVELVK